MLETSVPNPQLEYVAPLKKEEIKEQSNNYPRNVVESYWGNGWIHCIFKEFCKRS